MTDFNFLDLVAFVVFVLCWFGYSFFSDIYVKKSENLVGIIHGLRLKWMQNCTLRYDRGEDVLAIGQLMRSVTFFASTTVLIIAALTALFGYAERAVALLGDVPFIHISRSPIWEFKTIVLEIIFIYSFFKCTWALRQYNYALIMILATPIYKEVSAESIQHAKRNADILTNAARHFSLGIRGFYFGLITLGWFLHPVLYIVFNVLVILVLYRREFLSKTLDIVSVK